MATYGYVRVSTLDQVGGTSLAEQERQIRGAAMMLGLEVDHIYQENGVSGAKPLDQRPAGKDLLSVLAPGDIVIVSKLDRAFRSAVDALQQLQAFKDRGVSLHLLDIGGDVTGDGVAKLVFTILAAVAEAERARLKERQAQGIAAKRARGGHIGGARAPFGYRVVGSGKAAMVEPDPEQQRIIQYIQVLHRGRKSQRQIRAEVDRAFGLKVSLLVISRIIKQQQQEDGA